MRQLLTTVRHHGKYRRSVLSVSLIIFLSVFFGIAYLGLLSPQSASIGFDGTRASARQSISKSSTTPALSTTTVAAILEQDDNSPAEKASKNDPHRTALLLNVSLLEKGFDRLAKVSDYTATFFKQERLGGELNEEDVTQLKVRHSPFSVYMKWLVNEAGKDVLYVQGQNDDNMLVRQVGWKARLLPELNLDPSGRLAMSESRHPVTEVGLLPLINNLISYRRLDMKENKTVRCQVYEEELINDRPCYRFVIEYDDPTVSAVYRKSEQYIDKDLSLPVEVLNYTWPEHHQEGWGCDEVDEATLIEYYGYSDIKLNAELADLDFDRTNKEYGFKH